MVEVGQINVRFGADTSGFQQGFSNVKNSLAQTSKNTKSVRADFVRLAGTTADIARKAVFAFGAAGLAGGIAGIIAKSPALQPAFAQMKVGATQLSLSLGEVLAPAFDKLVTILPTLNKFVMENKDSLGQLFTGLADATTGVLDLAVGLGEMLLPYLADVATWFGENPAIFAGLMFSGTAVAGFTAAKGFLTTLGGLSVSPAVAGTIAALASVATFSYGVKEGLLDQFGFNDPAEVMPTSPAMKKQFENADLQESMDLANRYAYRITGTGKGPEQTLEIDPQTGELYTSKHQYRDIMAGIQAQLNNDDSWQAFIRAQQEGAG